MAFKPHEYQKTAIRFLCDRLKDHDGAGLFLDPGLGKTAITYSVLKKIQSQNTLVVAPRQVMLNTWTEENDKWGFGFKVVPIYGNGRLQKTKKLQQVADIHVINPESLIWALETDMAGWDTLVIDESTKFKNWNTKRMKALKKWLDKFEKRIILTGTPAPNSLADLFSQMYILDEGKTLGKTISYFRQRYMYQGGFEGREWFVRPLAEPQIMDLIAPSVLVMRAEDHLDMPELVYNVISLKMTPSKMDKYRSLERKLWAELDSGTTVLADGGGSKYSLCKGFVNGGIYKYDERGRRSVEHIHTEKTQALEDLRVELAGKPLLVAYQFNHDLERITRLSEFRHAPILSGATKPEDAKAIVKKWNERKLPVVLCQPQAVSHGMNLQEGGSDICWFGLTDQPEVYEQFNRRLYRQGQKDQVRIHHLLMKGTVDIMMYRRLNDKAWKQKTLMESIRNYRDQVERDPREVLQA